MNLKSLDSKEAIAAAIVQANPDAFSDEEHSTAAAWMEDYYRQLHHSSAAGTYPALPPPDRQITAQVLAASEGDLPAVLKYMAFKRLRARGSWAWFVPTIAEHGPLAVPRKAIQAAWADQQQRRAAQPASQAAAQPANQQRRAAK